MRVRDESARLCFAYVMLDEQGRRRADLPSLCWNQAKRNARRRPRHRARESSECKFSETVRAVRDRGASKGQVIAEVVQVYPPSRVPLSRTFTSGRGRVAFRWRWLPTQKTQEYNFPNGLRFSWRLRAGPLAEMRRVWLCMRSRETDRIVSGGTRPQCTRPQCTRPRCTRPRYTRPQCTWPQCTRPRCTRPQYLPQCTRPQCTRPRALEFSKKGVPVHAGVTNDRRRAAAASFPQGHEIGGLFRNSAPNG